MRSVLRERQRLASGDPQLLLDEIDAVHHLRDRMLDLQPGVHLHEEELVGPVGRDDELDRAGARVAARAGGLDRLGTHRRPHLGVEQRRRCLLDDLLMAALQAALALAEMDDVAVCVGQHLDLDVPRIADEALDQQRVVTERTACFAARRGDRVRQLLDRPRRAACPCRRHRPTA